jgi:heparanase 1
MKQWDAWQGLAQTTNIRIMFGLNYLGMVKHGKWDPKNAKELIQYTFSKFGGKPPVFGFELGNELSTRGPKPEEVVTGFKQLRDLIQSLPFKNAPKIAGPACGNGGPSNPEWIQKFLTKGGARLIDVATYHWYSRPSTDKNLSVEVMTTKFMNAEVTKTEQTKKDFNSWAPGVPLWQGEGALAALSGQHGLTDRFEDTLWYIVRLGALAANGHSVWNRQTLIGGYYALFDHKTLRPHPDWWAAVLHKRLMGTRVLSASSSETNIYSFAHCAKGTSGAVTVALVNLAASERSISFSGAVSPSSRDEYCLTSSALDGNSVTLNGGPDLTMADDGSIPELQPRHSSSATFVIPGHAVCFVTLRDVAHPACEAAEVLV